MPKAGTDKSPTLRKDLIDGRFEIHDTLLGAGSFGLAYKGLDTQTNKEIACKTVITLISISFRWNIREGTIRLLRKHSYSTA